ncbi:MAG: cadherin-like domain-containing protein [Bryobacterales bacterium]|nr:cadherin-like domain-containing protein [Bryobacterales bacterium]
MLQLPQRPNDDDRNSNRAPVVTSAAASTTVGRSVSLGLAATDADRNTLTLRIVTQPAHGTVGLSGRTATYIPEPNFTGSDRFTFAAWDGSTESNLGAVTVTVR